MRRLVLAIVLASVASASAAVDDPAPQTERKIEPERSQGRPSGFWGSTRPATNGAYRYRLLAIGIVLAAATGYVMLRLVRRANAERLARGSGERERLMRLAALPVHTVTNEVRLRAGDDGKLIVESDRPVEIIDIDADATRSRDA